MAQEKPIALIFMFAKNKIFLQSAHLICSIYCLLKLWRSFAQMAVKTLENIQKGYPDSTEIYQKRLKQIMTDNI